MTPNDNATIVIVGVIVGDHVDASRERTDCAFRGLVVRSELVSSSVSAATPPRRHTDAESFSAFCAVNFILFLLTNNSTHLLWWGEGGLLGKRVNADATNNHNAI